MKIADVDTRLHEDPFFPQLLVQLTTDEGLTGTGECWWGVSPAAPEIRNLNIKPAAVVDPIASVVENLLRPLLVGKPSDRIEDLWQQMIHFIYRYGDEGIVRCAVSGVDLALWDLIGKRIGVPVIQFLGGPVKDGLRAYASLPPLKDPCRLRQESKRARQAGFAGIKLHETDPQAAAIVREAVGPDVALMFDVNGHFSPIEALKIASRLQACDVYWFEEPVWPMRDHRAMGRIKNETGIGIAAGENEYDLDSFHRLMASGAADFIMPEITKIGGLTSARKISTLAELFNRIISPHGFRIGPALYANIHWALSCPVSDWIEVPFLPEGFEFPAGFPMPPMEDGMIRLPRGAGLGLPEGNV
jgi:L-alanine-DL-glutamate epimerase-like enolase superfamily enzyme